MGRADVVAFLLSRPGIDIEWGDTKGRNPLHNAIFGPRGGREGKKVVPKKLDLPVAVGYSLTFQKSNDVSLVVALTDIFFFLRLEHSARTVQKLHRCYLKGELT